MGRRFDQQVVWITGGGSGIGLACALEFARRGARVAVSGRREEKLLEAVEAIRAVGGGAIAVVCDVTQEQQQEEAVKEIIEEFGRLDVAMANAGFAVSGRIERLSAADWRRQLDTNITGAALTARYAIPRLCETKGRLVLVASVNSFLSLPGNGAYAVSKFGLRAMGAALAVELKGSGVSCTTIYPGFVQSDIAQVDNQGVYHADKPETRPTQLMWPADRAARVMVNAIHARRRDFVFTGHGKVAAFLGQHFPALVHAVLKSSYKARRREITKP